jgi:hypothetical protein
LEMPKLFRFVSMVFLHGQRNFQECLSQARCIYG